MNAIKRYWVPILLTSLFIIVILAVVLIRSITKAPEVLVFTSDLNLERVYSETVGEPVFSAESGCYTVCVTTLDGCTECRALCVTLPDAMLSSIYPNPADGEVNIDYQLSRRISGGTIQIISANGVKMYSQAVTNTTKGKTMKGSLKLSTAAFAPGQYIVRILSSKGSVYDSKILIVK